MQPKPKWSSNALLEWYKKLPRWLQYSLGSFVVILALFFLFTNPPANGDISDPFGNSFAILIDVTIKLGLVVLLIFVAAVVYRRWRPGVTGSASRQLDLLETMQLGPRRTLYLVKAGDQQLLIGATDQSIGLIAQIQPQGSSVLGAASAVERPELPSSIPAGIETDFSDILANSIEQQSDLD